MNTGKRKFASNLMAIIWFIIYLMPVMTFGFYSLGNIGDNKLYKDDVFSSSSNLFIENGKNYSGYINFDDALFSERTDLSLLFSEYITPSLGGFFEYFTFQLKTGAFLSLTSRAIFTTDYVDFIFFNVPLNNEDKIYLTDKQLLYIRIYSTDPIDFEIIHYKPVFYDMLNCEVPEFSVLQVSNSSPSFMDKTFAQFGYDSNNLDIVGQSIVDFGELVNFNGLTANSPATFFIWWFFLVTIVRLLFEIVAFIPKLAVKWLHYFSRE